ncbi:MAG: hypothetical protein O2894_03600 [Planctomycetota bacterium]|nr:hypothetical protein [Planctomycetota bacterium]
MHVQRIEFLASTRGAAALGLAREARSLPLHRRAAAMAGVGSAEEIRAALTQDDLRVRAAARCPHAEALLFTPEALEQATAWPVAAERATRWPTGAHVTDLGAGVGFDALATALAGHTVTAYEHDPARAACLRFNAQALEVSARVTVREEDVRTVTLQGALAYFDPERRPEGVRTRDPTAFSPPADTWPALLARFERVLVKLPPVLEGTLPISGPSEYVSLGGRAREWRLWVGAWEGLPARRALALPGGTYVEGDGVALPPATDPTEGSWLLDPDVTVMRAGLLGDLAARDGLTPVHPDGAYLVGPAKVDAAPGHWVPVHAVLKADKRSVQAWLDAHDVGSLTIRKRGIDARAEAWRSALRARGSRPATLVFTRTRAERWVVYAGLDCAGF